MTRSISTKDTAKLVRVGLKNAFPGVKFSVRMSTGTAAAWLNVSWSDGPTEWDVQKITGKYEGRSFNGMTDSYDDGGTALVAFEGDTMPEEVRFHCDGIIGHRDYTAAGYRHAQHLISTDSDHKDLVILTPDGEAVSGASLPQTLCVNGDFIDYIYGPRALAERILHRVNLSPIVIPSN